MFFNLHKSFLIIQKVNLITLYCKVFSHLVMQFKEYYFLFHRTFFQSNCLIVLVYTYIIISYTSCLSNPMKPGNKYWQTTHYINMYQNGSKLNYVVHQRNTNVMRCSIFVVAGANWFIHIILELCFLFLFLAEINFKFALLLIHIKVASMHLCEDHSATSRLLHNSIFIF